MVTSSASQNWHGDCGSSVWELLPLQVLEMPDERVSFSLLIFIRMTAMVSSPSGCVACMCKLVCLILRPVDEETVMV